MKATGIVVDDNLNIVGFVIKGNTLELGYNYKGEFENSFSIDDIKRMAGKISNIGVLNNGLEYTGSKGLNTLSCRNTNDAVVDNSIEIVNRLVENNQIVGFTIKAFNGLHRVPTKKLIDISDYMKGKNFIVRHTETKRSIASKYGHKALSELPAITIENNTNRCGDNVYWSINGGILKISGEGPMWYIMGGAFKDINKNMIHTVIVQDGVETIGDKAFTDFKNMQHVSIANSVTHIGTDAFAGCASLKSIKLPESLKVIGSFAFENCINLTSIKLPDRVKVTGYAPFNGCTKLKTIEIGRGLQGWNKIHCGCMNLSEIKIDNENETFKCRDGIVYNIGDKSVVACVPTIKGKVKLINGVKQIGDMAFFDCEYITQIDLGHDIEVIGKEAFVYCLHLKEVIVGDKLREIKEGAFTDCQKLKYINLPKKDIMINPTAFKDCNEFRL